MTALLDLRIWLATALALALAWGGVERVRNSNARTALAQHHVTTEKARASAEARERQIEAKRTRDVQEVANAAQNEINALEGQLADARAAADSLRAAAASAARRTCSRPAAAAPSPGESDSDAIGVLADVLGRVDERTGVLAEHADRLRIAGLACERAYLSLSPP